MFPHFVFGSEHPAEHEVTPFTVLQTCPAAQAFPHEPQLFTLVERLSQTPAALPPPPPPPGPPPPVFVQRVSPVGQVHVPFVHVAPVAHWFPHAPQFAALVLVSTHVCVVPPPPPKPPPPCVVHSVCPDAHPSVHAPLTQVWSPVQRFPHAPQFVLLDVVSTQVPLQLVSPPPQTHWPFEQLEPVPQALLHAPQSFGSLDVSTHAPPQFVSPAAQLVVHCPFEHTPPSHVTPQPPQLFGSLCVS